MQRFVAILLFNIIIAVIGDPPNINYRSHPNWPQEYDDICGDAFADRIVGGKNATLGQFPWIARIKLSVNGSPMDYNCGGSLITDRHVLTAAHCAEHRTVKIEGVLLGDWDASTSVDCSMGVCASPPQYRKAKQVIVADNWMDSSMANDIAIIVLEKPVEFNDWVLPICLPTPESGPASASAEVAGWGLLESPPDTESKEEMDAWLTRGIASILQYVWLPIVPMKECARVFRGTDVDEARQICAGGEKNMDSCSGDSGGPLMQIFQTKSGPRHHITGLVSFGTEYCGIAPAIYTRITHYLPFILNTLSIK